MLYAQASSNTQGYQIQRSLRFRKTSSVSLSRAITTTGSATAATFSTWIKRSDLGSRNTLFSNKISSLGINALVIEFGSSDVLTVANGSTADVSYSHSSTAVFRDPSSWLHIVVAIDTSLATSSDRLRAWVNNQLVITNSSIPQNALLRISNNAYPHTIGADPRDLTYFGGYEAEAVFIDGQALTPSSFGQIDAVTGQWAAKKYVGTYGTNGFYLPLNNITNLTTLCQDASGNGNHFTANNVSLTAGVTYDSMTDVPLGYGTTDRGNYATLNPLFNSGSVSEGNLKFAGTGATYQTAYSSIPVPFSTPIYFEVTLSNKQASGNNAYIGIDNVYAVSRSGVASGFYGLDVVNTNGNIWTSLNGTLVDTGVASVNGDVYQFAIDQANGKFWVGKNGSWLSSGSPSTGANPLATISTATEFSPRVGAYNPNNWQINFGQRPFQYTPPAGFKALHTGNLPTPAIIKPNQHFDVLNWVGDGSASKDIAGLQFSPGLSWPKERSEVRSHWLFNVINGAGNGLSSNGTNAETSLPDFVAFLSNGIRVSNSALSDITNKNAQTYVGWNWRAGGAPVSNTSGTITSQVSANITAGFSIVTYTGTGVNATVGHGLSAQPKMIIVKNRTGVADNWPVYHASIGNTQAVRLNLTNAVATSGWWNNTTPTSSLFSLGSTAGGAAESNTSGNTYVAYCFAEIAGYSKIGGYTGNGSADGVFIHCGFRPRYVLLKRTDAAGNWGVWDTARDIFNGVINELVPNATDAETTAAGIRMDIVSNGFKLRNSGVAYNASGGTYIFLAIAESPFKYALAR